MKEFVGLIKGESDRNTVLVRHVFDVHGHVDVFSPGHLPNILGITSLAPRRVTSGRSSEYGVDDVPLLQNADFTTEFSRPFLKKVVESTPKTRHGIGFSKTVVVAKRFQDGLSLSLSPLISAGRNSTTNSLSRLFLSLSPLLAAATPPSNLFLETHPPPTTPLRSQPHPRPCTCVSTITYSHGGWWSGTTGPISTVPWVLRLMSDVLGKVAILIKISPEPINHDGQGVFEKSPSENLVQNKINCGN
ncbi:hypothetical protein TIFTF001_033734 [Ficus carica]|uniref:Uncharacterized protein n=1 Tax=Ficus carica TaxID=3494 RepID=A0AA88DZB0_FICCA|nr:hypothetical protein TIFTF001_033734 [Ficus carica]